MNNDTVYYGLAEWDRLETEIDAVIERVLDDACDKIGEPFNVIADRIEWPIKVLVFKLEDLGGEEGAQRIADRVLEQELENLDEVYLTDYDDNTEATTTMKEAALAFGRAIVSDYEVRTCKPTGEVIEYTREEVEAEEWEKEEKG